jgi:serine/threonine-protein kinase
MPPSIEERLTAALGDRYVVAGELAHGGMATVYGGKRVADQAPVAIKVMHPAVAEELGPERFLREVAIAASMTHPGIVPLIESGTAGDLLYYIMPYVAGESLHDRLQRDRRLSLETAVGLARDVASALGYAHARGVIHRDVKPENLLIADGHALVADFGLARAMGSTTSQKLTRTGTVLGTIYYLSPEQLREERLLDGRADVYSLGGVLYEMLTGGPPYTGSSLKEVVMHILRAPVPSVRRLRPEVPPAVDEAISRALAKAPADRFPTMESFAAALDLAA